MEEENGKWNLMYLLVIGANIIYVLIFLYVTLSTQ